MGERRASEGELVQGTLDLLILKTLALRAMHGWGIARHIQQISREVLRVEEGSLYPSLRRLEADGYVTAEWAQSENNRRARYYTLTAKGRRRLSEERKHWGELVQAMARVLEA